MIRRRVLGAALAVAVLAPAACSDDSPGDGEARLEVDGEAVVERADGGEDIVRGSTRVRRGDRVELTEGTGSLALPGGTRFELRSGLADAAHSMLRMGEVPVLEAGDLLVVAPEATSVEAAGTTFVVAAGAAQVSRALGVAVAAYDGSVRLDSAGQERDVPALRQMLVPALGRPPQSVKPLVYTPDDPWDRRFLGTAIDLGHRLESLADGYTGNLNPGEGTTPGFFRLVLPELDGEPAFGADLIDVERPPGELLVGAAITSLGRRGEFVERWETVFDFRDQGAQWGLVALDQAVSGAPLIGSIEEAIGASPLAFVEPTPPAPPVTTPPPEAPPTTVGAAPSPTTTVAPTTTSPTTVPPTTAPPPPDQPLRPTLEPLVEPVTDLVGGLVGGLLGLLGP